MSEIYIYALVDPRDDQVRYVGQTRQPKTRLIGHSNPCSNKGDGPKQVWIRELLSHNLKPVMKILETLETLGGNYRELEIRANKAEANWIVYFQEKGEVLTNHPNYPAQDIIISNYFAEPVKSISLKLKQSVYNQLESQAKAAGKSLADYLESLVSEAFREQEAA